MASPTPKKKSEETAQEIKQLPISTPATSPRVDGSNKPEYMSFPTAMQAIIDGKRVTRAEWPEPKAFVYLTEHRLVIKFADDLLYHPLLVSDGDMLADDWMIFNHD